jgi:hypothetical protein
MVREQVFKLPRMTCFEVEVITVIRTVLVKNKSKS